jgi:hypothetical protein
MALGNAGSHPAITRLRRGEPNSRLVVAPREGWGSPHGMVRPTPFRWTQYRGTIHLVKQRTTSLIAWGALLFFLVGAAAGLWLRVRNVGWAAATEDLLFIVIFFSFGVVGALVASRQPRNAIGWIFLAITLTVEMAFLTDTYARYSFRVSAVPLPGAVVAAWLSSWAWVAFLAPTLTFLPLLFPDGRLPSPRWRTFAWIIGIVMVLAVSGFALQPGPLEGYRIPNPVGIPALRGTLGLLEGPSFLLLLGFAIVSVASLFLRYRRADPVRRQQIKWFVFAMVLTAAWFLVSAGLEAFGIYISWLDTIFSVLSFASIPVAAGIGILKYRLFDIDVVIRRTLLYGVLAAVITAV